MQQRFVDAGAVAFRCDVSAGGPDRFLHFRNRVRRAGGIFRETAVEHRDVVMVIARGENFFARDLEQA